MVEQIITNIATVGILGTGFAFLFKRWMDSIDVKLTAVCGEIEKKVDRTECKERKADEQRESAEIWTWLKYHGHSLDGAVIVPKRQ